LDASNPQLPVDGRQSGTAAAIQRGTGRLLRSLGFALLPEFSIATGRRADILGINAEGRIWIIEIKSSLQDYQSDFKWQEYGEFCDRFFFAIPENLPQEIIPATAGLIVADNWSAEVLRHPEEFALHASRRKALTLQFARAAAQRLHGLYDPPQM
jgi:hypothetical protein